MFKCFMKYKNSTENAYQCKKCPGAEIPFYDTSSFVRSFADSFISKIQESLKK